MGPPTEDPGRSRLLQPPLQPRREHQLQGPRPSPLKIDRDDHFRYQPRQLGQPARHEPVIAYVAKGSQMVCFSGRAQREMSSSFVLQRLAHPAVSIIGIYGEGGVGKTNFAIDIQNQLRNHCIHSVSWVTVSPKISIRNLQDDLARSLDFDLSDEDDEEKRVDKLSTALEERNTVLVLDNLLHCIPQEDVGISTRTRGCKLIFTTRSYGECQKMGCHLMIQMKRLSDHDSWELFTQKMGPDITFPHSIEQIAKSIVKECSGLPLAIVTMAANMKGVEDLGEWRSALNTIQEKNKVPQDDGCMSTNEIYRVLRYCYEKLKDPSAQQCLLYCESYPEGFKIDREMLIEKFIDAGLVDGNNREAEFNNGNAVLDKLESAFFLEGGTRTYGKRYVKMSNLVRDFLVSLSSSTLPSVFHRRLPEDDSLFMGTLEDQNQLLEMPIAANDQFLSLEDLESPRAGEAGTMAELLGKSPKPIT